MKIVGLMFLILKKTVSHKIGGLYSKTRFLKSETLCKVWLLRWLQEKACQKKCIKTVWGAMFLTLRKTVSYKKDGLLKSPFLKIRKFV